MSLLTVEKVTHGFGARQILEDASFRLLKGEHIGLIGANGEGKSTFLNIITGKLLPDAGKITWSRHVTVGYLDQHTVLKKGMTIREVLHTAFNHMHDLEAEMLKLYEDMALPENADKMDEMPERSSRSSNTAASISWTRRSRKSRAVWVCATSDWIAMFPICPAGKGPKCFWSSCCSKIHRF